MAPKRTIEVGPANAENFEYSWKCPELQVHLLSDVGEKREHNEDGCMLCVPEDASMVHDRGRLFAVADGMGGVSGGALASKLALQTLADVYYSGQEGQSIPVRMRAAIREANHRIFEEAENRPEYYGMGTTVSALVLHGSNAYVAHVGDSRVYLSRKGEPLFQITHDHSLVAEQLRGGIISEEEARNHSLKNLITRAVGTKEDVKVDLFTFPVREKDTLLLCSDGLCGVLEDTAIRESMDIDNLQGASRMLVGKALQKGGPDNITVTLVRLLRAPEKTAVHHGARKAALGKIGFFARLRSLFS
ncbi:MAG TPA: Stp1/IreP family PP2C-type Ser/Thr phosphatase [Candidatus Hydrogenedentes bacterium]|nr:Stp1/IreP family PP2C-type Ser/Thr phosphatase [Candidatus Hydrogenedentota bacterium]HQE82601.1 Stp1/IreP family PP2C-type Ser/Thr phosphatase [Candidatus Hydrogenedentota bacterium]HQH51515.1 Stp1/IreP family PP2C-type Ser/Thr phosphatase [Candidatus Hydrogenedentota bacterium]HQM50356.1 Stp1/IreP family PP2C-type Ser/Thr phosphatase [Candidatus Hydrogenedentota bacterium]